MQDTTYNALSFAQSLSPTGKEQQGFSNLYNDMRKAGESDEAIIIAILQAVCDGIRYGNWPAQA